MSSIFEAKEYLIHRKVFTLLSPKFHIYNAEGGLIGFSKQKAFKLREDIRIFSDESMEEERLLIKARQIIDFSAAYDVVDAQSGVKVGALRRKGFASMVRDSWQFLDEHDDLIGKVEEDSLGMALVRRYLFKFIPQSYHASVDDRHVATYRQHFNPFVFKMTVTIGEEADGEFDPRLLLAAGILLVAIEGRQG